MTTEISVIYGSEKVKPVMGQLLMFIHASQQRRSTNVLSMTAHRLRRWPVIELTLVNVGLPARPSVAETEFDTEGFSHRLRPLRNVRFFFRGSWAGALG